MNRWSLLKQQNKAKNVCVQNYHGFAYMILCRMGIKASASDLIQEFNRQKPKLVNYDMLVLDEYQDIEQEIAELLLYIKEQNANMQIIAVGDMKQKIYDKTTLDVLKFIQEFLGNYTLLHFTQCFRLSAGIATRLGNIWEKDIVGVNKNCCVEYMPLHQIIEFLQPKILRIFFVLAQEQEI